MAGRKAAVEELVKAGVSTEAAAAGISRIINLPDSLKAAATDDKKYPQFLPLLLLSL